MDVDDDPVGCHAEKLPKTTIDDDDDDIDNDNDNDNDNGISAHTLDGAIEADHLRILSRSPHPYHHINADLPHPAHRIASLPLPLSLSLSPSRETHHPPLLAPRPALGKDSTPASDSGTEADDEHFLKGLPAPRAKPRKGLRGMDEALSGLSTPLLSPVRNLSLSGRDAPLTSAAGHAGTRQDSCGDSDSAAGGSILSVFDDDDDDDGHTNGIRHKTGIDTADAADATGEETGRRRRPSAQQLSKQKKPAPCRRLSSRHRHGHKRDAALLDICDKDRRQGRGSAERSRRRREIVRRSTELLLLVSLAALLFSNPAVRPLLFHWRFELQAVTAITVGLLVLYPIRLVVWACRSSDTQNTALQRIGVPAAFDPAPLYYPVAIPVLVSFLLATPTLPCAPLLNLVLSICALPKQLIPLSVNAQLYDPVQWALSSVPVFVATRLLPAPFKDQALGLSTSLSAVATATATSSPPPPFGNLSPETAVLLYPLHQTLCWLLHDLTTTSLLPAELQLLAAALINLLVLARSPQAVILQALLWGGSLAMLVSGSRVVRWGIMFARIPRWRFRREQDAVAGAAAAASQRSYVASLFSRVWLELQLLRRARLQMMYGPYSGAGARMQRCSGDSSEDADAREPTEATPAAALVQRWQQHKAHITVTQDDLGDLGSLGSPGNNAVESPTDHQAGNPLDSTISNTDGIHEYAPRFAADDAAALAAATTTTTPAWMVAERGLAKSGPAPPPAPPATTTPSGRRKRAMSQSARALFSLTHAQAVRRKWMYAGFLYACIALTILVLLRSYIGAYALGGHEPFGWALGYLFGGIDAFRLEVVKANLEHWVCLPQRAAAASPIVGGGSSTCLHLHMHCEAGWVEHVRQAWLGAAATRLLLFAYWGLVIVFGLAVVFTLSPIYEVDTRRKVFHFMMVAVLLPATFVDPAFAGLALALVLSVFLLLDLLRASQLPPLSRPIAAFLTPYVDGRDLRGPVVISHIFLLIGCAIPLWLSLAALPRAATDNNDDNDCSVGWDVPTRDVSMVSGVICVGLGDAAASLIGRRWGRRKWVWGGGKSLEGSVAFATAVFVGIMAASLWLRVGGWPVTGEQGLLLASAGASSSASAGASAGVSAAAGSLDRTVAWIGGQAAQAAAPRAGVCAVVASLTEAVLTGGNDNVVVPVILWTCVKSFGL